MSLSKIKMSVSKIEMSVSKIEMSVSKTTFEKRSAYPHQIGQGGESGQIVWRLTSENFRGKPLARIGAPARGGKQIVWLRGAQTGGGRGPSPKVALSTFEKRSACPGGVRGI